VSLKFGRDRDESSEGHEQLLDALVTDIPEAASAATARLPVVAVNRLRPAGTLHLIDHPQDFFAHLVRELNPPGPVWRIE
jgi:hypothetical protein